MEDGVRVLTTRDCNEVYKNHQYAREETKTFLEELNLTLQSPEHHVGGVIFRGKVYPLNWQVTIDRDITWRWSISYENHIKGSDSTSFKVFCTKFMDDFREVWLAHVSDKKD
jgi:hypothetical protein